MNSPALELTGSVRCRPYRFLSFQGYRLLFSASPLGSFSHRGAFADLCVPSGIRTQHWSFPLWVDPREVTENRIRVGRTCSTPAGSQKQQTWCGMFLVAIALPTFPFTTPSSYLSLHCVRPAQVPIP